MRRMHILGMGLMAGLGWWPVQAAAAPPACAGPQRPVERLICAHPALRRLDAAVEVASRAVTGASVGARKTAVRDQAMWRSDRDDVLWGLLSQPKYFDHHDVLRRAWALERARLDYLLGLHRLGVPLSPPLDGLAEALRAGSHPVRKDVLATWADRDGSVHRASDAPGAADTAEDRFRSMHLKPTPALLRAVKRTHEHLAPLDAMWLRGVRLGATETIEGTAECQYLAWFATDTSGGARSIPSPGLDASTCHGYGTDMTLLQVGHRGYVVRVSRPSVDVTDISMQWWTGVQWANPERVRVRFSHALSIDRVACGGGDCARYRGAMLQIARRYDRSPQPGMLPGLRRSQGNPATGRQLHALRRDLDKAGAASLDHVPFLSGYPLHVFGAEATWFVRRMGGQLLLGRIGHGHLGWRRDSGWLVGLWADRSGAFVPVAGAVVGRGRDRVLGVAPMPVRLPTPH